MFEILSLSNNFVCHWIDENTKCKTPNNLDGNCIPLEQCSSLQSIVSSNQHQTLLSQSYCGSEGIKPHVSLYLI